MMPRRVENNFLGFNWLPSSLSGTFLTRFPDRTLPTRIPTYKTSSDRPILIFYKGKDPFNTRFITSEIS